LGEPVDARRIVCARAELVDGGLAVRFDIERSGTRFAGFAISHRGEVHAYHNSCPHRGTELDWQPGEVFDETGLYLVCATHGAVFAPDSGRCTGGPCLGASLNRIAVSVENHQIVLQVDQLALPLAPINVDDSRN
jgi:nitrite reductase/ring-hydroxylating ferredoxin subunit